MYIKNTDLQFLVYTFTVHVREISTISAGVTTKNTPPGEPPDFYGESTLPLNLASKENRLFSLGTFEVADNAGWM